MSYESQTNVAFIRRRLAPRRIKIEGVRTTLPSRADGAAWQLGSYGVWIRIKHADKVRNVLRLSSLWALVVHKLRTKPWIHILRHTAMPSWGDIVCSDGGMGFIQSCNRAEVQGIIKTLLLHCIEQEHHLQSHLVALAVSVRPEVRYFVGLLITWKSHLSEKFSLS